MEALWPTPGCEALAGPQHAARSRGRQLHLAGRGIHAGSPGQNSASAQHSSRSRPQAGDPAAAPEPARALARETGASAETISVIGTVLGPWDSRAQGREMRLTSDVSGMYLA